MLTTADQMPEVFPGLLHADYPACEEYLRLHDESGVSQVLAAAALLRDVLWPLQWADPERMMRWKMPENPPAVDAALLQSVLQACATGTAEALRQYLAPLSLEHLATLGSLAARLHLIAQQRRGLPLATAGDLTPS